MKLDVIEDIGGYLPKYTIFPNSTVVLDSRAHAHSVIVKSFQAPDFIKKYPDI